MNATGIPESQEKQAVFQLTEVSNVALAFYENHLRYQGKTFFYRDMTGISFHIASGSPSTYDMPVFTSPVYRLQFITPFETCVVEFYPFDRLNLRESNRVKEEELAQLYQRMHQLVKPYVVLKLLLLYSETETSTICNVNLSAKGITTRNVWEVDSTLEWKNYEKAELKNASVYLIRNDNEGGLGEFFFCSTDAVNAFVLPDILNYLKASGGVIDDPAKSKISARLSEMA